MKYKKTRIDHGGLMRCCVDTIGEHVNAHLEEEVPEEPFVLDCKHEKPGNKGIILKDGVWQWHNC